MCDALHYLLDNIFIRYGSKLFRQIVGIPMEPNCAPLVCRFFFCFVIRETSCCRCLMRDTSCCLSQAIIMKLIEAFNSISRYLDDLLNVDNPYFEQMVGQLYPTD